MSPALEEIQYTLRNMANPEIALNSLRFFKTGKGQYGEGDVFLGLRVPDLRKAARPFENVSLSVCADLLASAYHEERMFALILLTGRFHKADSRNKDAIYHVYLDNIHHVNNWDLVDISAPAIIGGHFIGKDARPLIGMAESRNLWERRIAIVATLAFIRRNELAMTFQISEILLQDNEDLIHKATGWMLREAGKKDPAVLEEFLKAHCRIMPRTMLRYAIERFEENKRRGYLGGTI